MRTKPTDLTADPMVGMKFGRWTVLRRDLAPDRKHVGKHFLCRCDCGAEKVRSKTTLLTGRSTSCGCYRRERLSGQCDPWEEYTPKEALADGTPRRGPNDPVRLKSLWRNMLHRCLNDRNANYRRYGAQGLGVCDRWRFSFDAFVEDMGPREEGQSIDRIDNTRGYEPGNCRWATATENVNNRACTLFVELDGVRMPLADACRAAGLSYPNVQRQKAYHAISLQAAFDRILARKRRPDA